MRRLKQRLFLAWYRLVSALGRRGLCAVIGGHIPYALILQSTVVCHRCGLRLMGSGEPREGAF